MVFSHFERSVRIASLLKKRLSFFLQMKSRDPRFHSVIITRVKVSRDLSQAKVFVSLSFLAQIDRSKPVNQPELIAALNRAAPYFRRLLGDSLHLRRVPGLRFVDAALDFK